MIFMRWRNIEQSHCCRVDTWDHLIVESFLNSCHSLHYIFIDHSPLFYDAWKLKLLIFQLKSTREKTLKWKKGETDFIEDSQHVSCELKHFVFWNSLYLAPAAAVPHMPRLSTLPSTFRMDFSLNKWQKEFLTIFYGANIEIYGLSRSGTWSYFCVPRSSAPKAHRMHRIQANIQPQQRVRYSFIYSLSFFFFYRYVFLYTHCHLSSFASAKENVEKIWRKSILNLSHCSSLVPKLFEQKPNTSLLCILDSLFTSFFGQSKETKSHLRRQSNKWWSPPPHTMITQNILTLLMSMLLLCPFSITFFISGSLKKFIGSFPFFLLFSH